MRTPVRGRRRRVRGSGTRNVFSSRKHKCTVPKLASHPLEYEYELQGAYSMPLLKATRSLVGYVTTHPKRYNTTSKPWLSGVCNLFIRNSWLLKHSVSAG